MILSCYPLPFKSDLHIDLYLQEERMINVELKNELGTLIEKNIEGIGHLNAIVLEQLEFIPEGSYNLEITFGDTRITKKVEKINPA